MSEQARSYLQRRLVQSFRCWVPTAPELVASTASSLTLTWTQQPHHHQQQRQDHQQLSFGFLHHHQHLLYRLDRKEKVPSWVTVYSGGKNMKEILDLGPATPHKFRVRVSLRPESVPLLAELAVTHFGSEQEVYEALSLKNEGGGDGVAGSSADCEYTQAFSMIKREHSEHTGESGGHRAALSGPVRSQWSTDSWAATSAVGQTPASFCMAVRGGYDKQVLMMLKERPSLLDMINTTNGYTPLATAANRGDVMMVQLLLEAGAAVDALSCNGRTALQVALLAGHADVAVLLMDAGTYLKHCDVVGQLALHCAVAGGSVPALRAVMARDTDLHAVDDNGWTPLYRAVVGGASTPILMELIGAGSDVNVEDRVGLPLLAVARGMVDHSGLPRETAIRLLDPLYGHETATLHFTRLTRKLRTLRTAITYDGSG